MTPTLHPADAQLLREFVRIREAIKRIGYRPTARIAALAVTTVYRYCHSPAVPHVDVHYRLAIATGHTIHMEQHQPGLWPTGPINGTHPPAKRRKMPHARSGRTRASSEGMRRIGKRRDSKLNPQTGRKRAKASR